MKERYSGPIWAIISARPSRGLIRPGSPLSPPSSLEGEREREDGKAEGTAMAEAAEEVRRHMPMPVRIFVGGLGERYNGCVWKGGRLKLEKAKGHFLLRLEREWEGDAAMSSLLNDASGADEVPEQPQKPKKSFNPESEIRIFFPRLSKAGLIAEFTGYVVLVLLEEQERVEALPYRKHFCNCEEHSGPSSLPSIEQRIPKAEALDGGIDAMEFDLMRSVMNKLFEKEMGSETMRDEKKLAKQEVMKGMDIDEPQQEDAVEEDSGEDEDGLIINIVRSSRSTRPKMNKIEDEEEEIQRDQEESGDHEDEESDERNDEESDEHDDEESTEHDDEESDEHDDEESDGRGSLDSEDPEFDKHSDVDDSVDGEDHESDKRNVCVEADLKESNTVLGNRNEETQDYRDDTAVTNKKQQGNEPSNALVNGKEEAPITSSLGEESKNLILQSSMESNPGTSHKREKKGVATSEKVPLCIGEECLFMKSFASLRDRANSKAALTGSRKRKKM
ncbi:hypothetical protein CRG98_036041 [Punica granatum]|uniref:Uncharacterized protein n=1 Tax=Punica granatum TaxID=22663 RepID=A0A2I0IHR7_PUNGR|nr:hypothetical protein CRG98_036041 [Punica granatum]